MIISLSAAVFRTEILGICAKAWKHACAKGEQHYIHIRIHIYVYIYVHIYVYVYIYTQRGEARLGERGAAWFLKVGIRTIYT